MKFVRTKLIVWLRKNSVQYLDEKDKEIEGCKN